MGRVGQFPVRGLRGNAVRGQDLVLLASGRWGVLVEFAQGHEPHCAAGQVDAHVVAAAFLGPADEGGLDAGRAEVAGDVVVHDVGGGERGPLGGALFGGEPGDAEGFHVKPGPVAHGPS